MCVILGSFDLGTVITHFRKVREGKRAARSVLSIIENHAVDLAEGKLDEASASGEIKFSNVTFKYPGSPDKTVLKDFSQVFEANKSTAIFGEADADTSAIIKLIERFYDLEQGDISIGG
jgi:ABC-type multidrug transport system fused ATPase/permease subunit